MAAPNANYDEILATTLANHQATMIDNVFTARPFAYFLKQAGQLDVQDGGHKIVVPNMFEENSTAGSYSGADIINTAPQGGISAIEYDWRQYAASVVIEGIEEAKNAGERQVLSLLKAKIEQAENTIIERMDSMFITSDGTGNGARDWNGLANLVAQNSTSVGGIDPATYSWWNSYIESTSTALTVAAMNTAYNPVSEGNDQPGFILTTQSLYEKYESLLQPNMRYESTEVGDAGFLNLMFKRAPVLFDRYVTSTYRYFLNPKYLRLVVMSGKFMTPTKFKEPPNQDIRVAQILCYGNLTVLHRKRQGVLTNRT